MEKNVFTGIVATGVALRCFLVDTFPGLYQSEGKIKLTLTGDTRSTSFHCKILRYYFKLLEQTANLLCELARYASGGSRYTLNAAESRLNPDLGSIT